MTATESFAGVKQLEPNHTSGTGTVYFALTNGTTAPTELAIKDAMGWNGADPVPADNANVIVYAITATSNYTTPTAFAWSAGDSAFKGLMYDFSAAAKGDNVAVTIGAVNANSFSSADTKGTYSSTLTLTAAES